MTADWEQIAKLHAEGKSASQIARLVGCTARTVVRWRAANGLSDPPSPFAGTRISSERLEAVRRMVEDGASVNEIQRTLHVWRPTIIKYFPEARWSRGQTAEFIATARRFNQIINPRSGRREA